jgi:sugar phosphate isomerase/epimerase
MKLGLVTYQLAKDWDVSTIIRNCEETGFEGVELRTTHAHEVEPSLSAEEREEIKLQFEKSNVALVALGSTCEYHSDDPAEVARNVKNSRTFIDLAVDVGAPGVKVRPNGLQEDNGIAAATTLEQIGKALAEVGAYADEKNIEIWLEVHGKGSSHPPYCHTILETANHPRVNACWNCNQTDLDDNGSIEAHFEMLKSRIKHVHLHDLYEAAYPYDTLFKLLKEMGYDGYTMAESSSSEDPLHVMKYYKALWDKLTQ